MFSHIVDEQIQLKLLQLEDAEELFEVTDRNRVHLRVWLPWVDMTQHPEDSREFIRHSLREMARNNGFQAGIFHKGFLVGCIGLNGIDWNNRKTSIGYWLASDAQGKGIMTRCVKAVLDYIFHNLELNRVEIRAGVYNRRSRAIPERLGFIQEGIIRDAEWLYDHFIDHVVYGMLKADWKTADV
jgi:ribosomal-protein-serine acetyltransferase